VNEMKRIQASGLSSYQIHFGRELLHELEPALGPLVKKVLLVYPEPLEESAALVAQELSASGNRSLSFCSLVISWSGGVFQK